MSDASEGKGWWEAADGKWYRPELHPDYRPPPPPGAFTRSVPPPPADVVRIPASIPPPPAPERSGVATWVKVALGVVGAFVVLGVIGAMLEDGEPGEAQNVSTDTGQPEATATTTRDVTPTAVEATTTIQPCPPAGDDTQTQCLYPDRADSQPQDHEQLVGGSVRLAGYTATVRGIRRGEWIGRACLLVEVTIENRDKRSQRYSPFDWKVQNEAGQVLDTSACGYGQDSNIGSASLVPGGSVSGTIGFEVGSGVHYVIYKPDVFNAARGIWRIEVE